MGGVAVCIPTLSDPELLGECAESVALQRGLDPRDVLLVCNSPRVHAACSLWTERVGFELHHEGTNLGTCRSWNLAADWAFDRGKRGVLVLNDDVRLNDERILKSVEDAVAENPARLIVLWRLGFSAFVLTPELVSEVGYFDEGFWPAYFEDNDYHLRCIREGFGSIDLPADVTHQGSQSLRRWKEWEDWNANYAFPTNARRFLEKWGGPPSHTRWPEPWDGGRLRSWNTRDWLMQVAPPPPWGW